jgi:hypothetical protein
MVLTPRRWCQVLEKQVTRVLSTTTSAHAAAGASGARHSLRPLIGEGGKSPAKLGRIRPRDREGLSENTR